MISKAEKEIEQFLKDKEELYKKADTLSEKYRLKLIDKIIKIISGIISEVKKGTPNGTELIELYIDKDDTNSVLKEYEEIRDISNVELVKGGMDLISLSFKLESVENKSMSFHYSYRNIHGIEIFVNKDQHNIDIAILLHIIKNLIRHPFLKEMNFKYLMKLNEFKNR